MPHLSYLAIHIDNISLALVGIRCKSTRFIDVAGNTLALFIGYRIGVHHRTIDFHGSIILWNNQPVTLTQNHICITARMLERFGEIDAYRIFFWNTKLQQVSILCLFCSLGNGTGIITASSQLQKIFLLLFSLHFQNSLHACFFSFICLTHQAGALDICLVCASSSLLEEIA